MIEVLFKLRKEVFIVGQLIIPSDFKLPRGVAESDKPDLRKTP